MSIKVVLFDLDGTLLPMNQEVFIKAYFKGIATKLAPHGYEPKQLIDAIWAGTTAMIKNTGKKSNEDVFWDDFVLCYGEKVKEDIVIFHEFYKKEFDTVQNVCGYNPQAAETIAKLKNMGLRLVLATNPIFPAVATQKRIRWAGLVPEDFEFYTTYENSNYCKPNPQYYKEIIKQLGVQPEECLMVGNDVGDDMVAEVLGVKVFLLTDCLINKEEKDISVYPHGNFTQLLSFIDEIYNKTTIN